jgi:hypothetical protein
MFLKSEGNPDKSYAKNGLTQNIIAVKSLSREKTSQTGCSLSAHLFVKEKTIFAEL